MFKSLCAKAGLMAALLAALVFTTCQSLSSLFQEPLLSLHSAGLAGLSFSGAQVLCKVNVENPNAFDIPFPQIDWEFFVNDNSFVRGTLKNDQSLKSRGTTVVDVPVSFSFLDIFNTFASLKGGKQADYKVALAAKFTLPILGDKVWHFAHEGVLPLLKAPSLSFNGISVKDVSLSKIDFELAWEVENPNSFALDVKDLSYSLAVNNSQWASGKVSASPQIGADRKTLIPLTISISSLAMVMDITDIIATGKDAAYACAGNISLGIQDSLGSAMPVLGDFNNPFSFSGTTKLRK